MTYIIYVLTFQFGLGDAIIKGEKDTLTREIRVYIRRLAECVLYHMEEGVSSCMIRWWEDRGWTYPWVYPVC